MTSRSGVPQLMRAAVVGVLLPLQLTFCTTWRVRPESPRDVIATGPRVVRYTLANGSQGEVYQPRIVADSLVGLDAGGAHVGMSLALIRVVEVGRFDGGKTALSIVGVVAVGAIAIFVFLAIALSGEKS
jgi:hypothetical protein